MTPRLLLAAALLAPSAPAFAQLDPEVRKALKPEPAEPPPSKEVMDKRVSKETGCTQKQLKAIHEAVGPAAMRTLSAKNKAAGIAPPGPEKTLDAGELARHEARNAFVDVFREELDADGVASVLGDMAGQLSTLNGRLYQYGEGRLRDAAIGVACGAPKDPECAGRLGYVRGNRLPITLCPEFFKEDAEQRTRTLVHEAAHAVGIGDSGGESYFEGYLCGQEDLRIIKRVGRNAEEAGKKTPRTDWADAWTLLVTCMTSEGDSPDNVIEVGAK